MADTAPRVVILGRAGEAQQQLLNALNELGAHTLAVGDFDQLDPVAMREQQPDVWLVSIDEGTDSGRLEPWQPLFDDPDATVIFDDADVTRRLSGWDLARWARHLAAKLLRRDDVLPPVSPDAERLPQALVDGNSGEGERETAAGDGMTFSANVDSDSDQATPSVSGELSLADDADFAALSASFESERSQRESHAEPPATALDDLLMAHAETAATANAEPDAKPTEPHSGATPASEGATAGLSLLDMDVNLSTPRAARPASPEVSIDVSHLELQPLDEAGGSSGLPSPPVREPAIRAAEVAAPQMGGVTLSLVEETNDEVESATSASSAAATGGMIAIIAGLGGPDSVRQFLGALPANLSVPVLLWQHLDAGKHDRLAQQLAKAAKLPVYLANPGDLAKPGEVGVMGAGLGLVSDGGWRISKGSPSPSHAMAPALKDPRTVLVVLSGAEPVIAEFARAHKANGGTVLVQTSATCFDGTAAAALESQGIASGSPGNLAARALERLSAG